MNWFYHSESRPSEKNGDIRVRRVLGEWEVGVGNTSQTSGYTNAMWKDAMKRVKDLRTESARNALLLGLGGGGAVHAIHTYFPDASVTAIEHDPVMVGIAKDIGLYKPFPFPQVLVGDARDIVPTLPERFDVIIVDIFEGKKLSPALTNPSFLETLGGHLGEQGILVANVSGHRELIRSIAETFSAGTIYRFRINTLGIFWNK